MPFDDDSPAGGERFAGGGVSWRAVPAPLSGRVPPWDATETVPDRAIVPPLHIVGIFHGINRWRRPINIPTWPVAGRFSGTFMGRGRGIYSRPGPSAAAAKLPRVTKAGIFRSQPLVASGRPVRPTADLLCSARSLRANCSSRSSRTLSQVMTTRGLCIVPIFSSRSTSGATTATVGSSSPPGLSMC